MVVVHALDVDEPTLLRRWLPPDEGVCLAPDPNSFRETAATSDAVVVVGNHHEPSGWLVRWRGRHPALPLVLVAESDDPPPSILKALVPDRMVTAEPVAEVLPAALRQARLLGLLHRWAGELAADSPFPPRLRDALVRAARTEPVPNASRIVLWTGCDPSTVYRWWR